MNVVAATIYWAIVLLWLAVLVILRRRYANFSQYSKAVALFLLVITIDAARNIIESAYFGIQRGADYGLFPSFLSSELARPELLILPKILNVLAACAVLALLLRRHLPSVLRDQSRVEDDLRDAEQRFRTLVDGVKEYAIYLLDLDGNVTSWNAGAERIKGYTADEAIGTHVSRFYTARDRLRGAPAAALETARRDGRLEVRGQRVRKDGSIFWANVVIEAIRDSRGELMGFAKVTKDITESQAAAERLEYSATRDGLTGLLNRASLFADLRAGANRPVALALFDLDGFKEINDAQGHLTGDRLLQQVSSRLIDAAGASNRIYRLGGDEFILLASGVTDQERFADSIRHLLNQLEQPFVVEGDRQHIGASAGVVLDEGRTDAETLLANADLALYEAKAGGGSGVQLFAPSMRVKAEARQALDKELRRACAEREFVLFFQPQVRLNDGAIVGAEALLRWRHPSRGLLTPDSFIGALARSPAALECGSWVVEEACRVRAGWRDQGLPPVRLGVNLFPAQFHQGAFETELTDALHRHSLPWDSIEIEITENIALDHEEDVVEALRRLHDRGMKVAFDDFGTGYASLSCLTRYPLDRIKIDHSFIEPLREQVRSKDSAVVRSMITMAHHLGLEVIAEGIETPEQSAFLKTLRCEEGQGFLYAPPMEQASFEGLLRQSSAGQPAMASRPALG